MWKGLPVQLGSPAAGHSDEAPAGDETWDLSQAQSVSLVLTTMPKNQLFRLLY